MDGGMDGSIEARVRGYGGWPARDMELHWFLDKAVSLVSVEEKENRFSRA